MSTHTPGPWKVYGGTHLEGTCLKVTANNANRPFYALVGGSQARHDDANLIAAAPTMYAALKGLERMLRNDQATLVEMERVIKQALAQAEGKVTT